MSVGKGWELAMTNDEAAQLQMITHENAVHAALLMDLLRLAHWSDSAAYDLLVRQAERELREGIADPKSALHGPGSHRVLEQRLAFLRAVQIGQAAPG
jgi:hypothetical protein